MNYNVRNLSIIVSSLVIIVACSNKKTKTLEEEMKERNCVTKKYDLKIPKGGLDSLTLLKRYDEVLPSANGYMRVIKNGKTGLVDSLGRKVIEPKYEHIRQYPGNFFKVGHKTKSEEKDLIILDTDKLYICHCEKITKLYGGHIEIKVDGRYGIVDSLGRLLLPTIYKNIFGIGENNLVSATTVEGGGIVSLNNEVIVPFEYGKALDFGDRNIAPIRNKEGKWAIVNETGSFKTPFVYDDIQGYRNNVAKANKAGKEGLLDAKGNPLTDFKYDVIWNYDSPSGVKKFGNKCYIPIELNKKWGILMSTGKELVPPIYDERVNWNLPTSVKRNGLWTFINKNGNEVVSPSFEEIKNPQNKIVGVMKKGKWGFVSQDGNQKPELIYDSFYSEPKSKYSIVNKDGKYSFINSKGEVFISNKDSVQLYVDTEHGFNIYENGKWGVLDSLGKEIVPFKYDVLGSMRFGNAIAKKGGKYGIISHNDQIILPFEYDEMSDFEQIMDSEITAPIKLNHKWGRVDINGNIYEPIIHSSYEDVSWDEW